MQGSRVGRRPPRAVIQNPTHRLPAIMSLRASLSVKFKQTILGIGALQIFNLNYQLKLARHAPWFPNFLLSQFHIFPPALRAAKYGWYSGTTFWIASLI